MITRRRGRLRTVELTSSPQFQLWLKDLDVYEGMAQYPPRVAAAELGIVIRKPGCKNGNRAGFLRPVFGNGFNTRVSHKVAPRVHASHLRVQQSDEGAGSVRGGTMRRALFQCESSVDLNIMSILRAQLHDFPEGQ